MNIQLHPRYGGSRLSILLLLAIVGVSGAAAYHYYGNPFENEDTEHPADDDLSDVSSDAKPSERQPSPPFDGSHDAPPDQAGSKNNHVPIERRGVVVKHKAGRPARFLIRLEAPLPGFSLREAEVGEDVADGRDPWPEDPKDLREDRWPMMVLREFDKSGYLLLEVKRLGVVSKVAAADPSGRELSRRPRPERNLNADEGDEAKARAKIERYSTHHCVVEFTFIAMPSQLENGKIAFSVLDRKGIVRRHIEYQVVINQS